MSESQRERERERESCTMSEVPKAQHNHRRAHDGVRGHHTCTHTHTQRDTQTHSHGHRQTVNNTYECAATIASDCGLFQLESDTDTQIHRHTDAQTHRHADTHCNQLRLTNGKNL